MTRVCIICEGQTEQEFVETCLYRTFLTKGIYLSTDHLRGNVSIQRVAQFARNNYANYDFLTTLIDFYGFKQNPCANRHCLELEILTATQRLFDNLNPAAKFRPYVQMYEFEGLLFSDISKFAWVMLDDWNADYAAQLQAIRAAVDNPECINNSPSTAPSKRLQRIFGKSYDKVEHGALIAEDIGLATLRTQCPNFNEWLAWLESLSPHRN